MNITSGIIIAAFSLIATCSAWAISPAELEQRRESGNGGMTAPGESRGCQICISVDCNGPGSASWDSRLDPDPNPLCAPVSNGQDCDALQTGPCVVILPVPLQKDPVTGERYFEPKFQGPCPLSGVKIPKPVDCSSGVLEGAWSFKVSCDCLPGNSPIASGNGEKTLGGWSGPADP